MPPRDYTPFLTEQPNAAPTPMQHIKPNADPIAPALQRAGANIEQAGEGGIDVATKAKQLFNETNVNEAQSTWIQTATDMLYKPATGDDANDGGFYTKRGDTALTNYDTMKGALEKSHADAMAALPDDRQRNMFAQLTRRNLSLYLGDMGRYVDRETTQAADAKTTALLGTLGQQASLAGAAGNMEMFDEAINQGTGAAKSWGRAKGYGEEWGNNWSQKWVGQTVANAAEQLGAAGKLKEASAMVDKYAPEMDKGSVLAVKTKLKGALEDVAAESWARNTIYGASPDAPDLGAISGKIMSIEGTGKNPRSSAEGGGQFTNATWLETIRGARPDIADKSDAELLEMRKDPQLAGAMTENYAARNAQTLAAANLPATPGNVYLAHFLGPQGAIKALSADPDTPIASLVGDKVVAANPQLAGKTAGDVAKWADLQMAGVAPGGGDRSAIKMDKARTYAQADAAFAGDPAMQRKVGSAINRMYASVQLDAAARQQEAQERNAKAYTGFADRILANDPADMRSFIKDLHDNPDLTGEHKLTLMRSAEERAKQSLNKDDLKYGDEYSGVMRSIDQGQIKHDDDIWKRTYDRPAEPPDFALTGAPGMKSPGNIEVWNRPVLRNPDGGYSTTSSMSIGTDAGEVLIPTVVNGKRLSEEEAIERYRKTGENLGMFDTPENADKFATDLHNAQATMYDQHGNPRTIKASLTTEGAKQASDHLKRRYSPKDFGDAELDRAARASAEGLLSNEMEIAGVKIPDPNGKRIFENRFLPAYYASLKQGVDKGLTYSQMLTEGSKDYIIAPLLERFKRTPAQNTADAINAREVVTARVGIDVAPPPAPEVGKVVDGYRFKGGNPAEETSWEAVAAPQAPVGR